MQILLSKEHAEYSKEVADCFQGLDAKVDASYMRLSEGDLPMQVIISLVTGLFTNAIYDYLKPSIKKFYDKFSKAHVLIRAPEGIMFSIDSNGSIRPIVVPDRASEFADIKTIDDLMKYLKGEEKEGWVETTLGEVCDITSSKRIFANEYQLSGVPFFRGKEVTEKFNGNNISTELFITEEKYNQIKNDFGVPQENDILLTSVGTLGNPYLVEKNVKFYFKDGNLTWFRKYKNIDPKYLFYWIVSPQGKETLSHAVIGSTQQAYTIVSLKKLPIFLPPLAEQRAIAAVLSSLDDKIELLREQNKTLEAMAQELFREWFTEFNFPDANGKPYKKSGGKMTDSELGEIPEGWRVGRFTEIAAILSGGTPKTDVEEYWGNSIPFFTPKDAMDTFYVMNTEKNLTELGLKNCNSRLYPRNTVFITARGTVGKCILSSRDMAMNQSCYALSGIDTSNLYIFLLLEKLVESLKRNASGSVFDAITVSTFHSLSVVIPKKIVVSKFADTISPVFQKILDNLNQIQTLFTLCDELLPRLMKGKIKINP